MNARLALLPIVALVAAGTAVVAQDFDLPANPTSHEVSGFVGLVVKMNVPAPEPGVLTYVGVREGTRFQAEDRIAEIDSREMMMAYKIAGHDLKIANFQASDEVQIEYALKQEGAETADYEGVLKANEKKADTVPETDVRRERLEMERATAGVKRARQDRDLARLEADKKRDEMKAAADGIDKRIIRAKFAGEVLKLFRKEGEWVQPGDTIAEIAQLDTLQVDGQVYFEDYTQRDIANCRVTVHVDAGGGRGVVEAPGYIVWASPLVEDDGRLFYRVRAEFANRQENGQWLINPGLPAKMEIHLGTQGEQPQLGQRGARGGVAR